MYTLTLYSAWSGVEVAHIPHLTPCSWQLHISSDLRGKKKIAVFKGKVNPIQSTTEPKTKTKTKLPTLFEQKATETKESKTRPPNLSHSSNHKNHFSKTCHDLIPQLHPKWVFPQNPFSFSFILWFSLPIWSLSHLPNLFLIQI